ncbi:cyclin-like protein [Peniophora sp. CONT]|nr:cyclin-like protein [Peniophora sp. CONT]
MVYPLASLEQIQNTPSAQDGVPSDLENDLRAYGCKLIHEAGLLLKQKQVAVACAQILFQRFYYVSSLKQFSISDTGMGALYLASKLEECPVRMRDLINVYDLLLKRSSHPSSTSTTTFKYDPMPYFSDTFYDLREALVVSEMQILKRLGFNVSVTLPYGSLVNYMKLLDLAGREDAVARAWGYLNDSLQTPVYALYPVPTIVCASILLTSRFLNIPLPDGWWELFDAEFEDVWSVCGWTMRLYRDRSEEESSRVVRMTSKRTVREWLEANGNGKDVEMR